jgi:hypothetical protein
MYLSGDNITTLAGQNEAGKTAVLTALRDFDLEEGKPPLTREYMPEGRYNAKPSVSVQFEIDVDELRSWLLEDNQRIPTEVFDRLERDCCFWIERDLLTGTYDLDQQLKSLWDADESAVSTDNNHDESEGGALNSDNDSQEEDDDEDDEDDEEITELEPNEFATLLRSYWPIFIYFDSFEDTLPREIDVDILLPQKKHKTSNSEPATVSSDPSETASSASGASTLASDTMPISKPPSSVRKSAPQSVHDFITLSDLDLSLLTSLSGQDKALGNYLQRCGAKITGDFLTYWKQKVDKDQTIDLHVRHTRDEQGTLKLAFYIRDVVDQYPEQRSKGFLWFLSFYLRLAAAEKRESRSGRLLLIDEPGSYLHARAQRDVLHLFEDRIAKQQQVIYSTHSPFLLPADKLHRIRIVLRTRSKGTLVLDRLTHPELRGDDFADTLSPIITSIGLDIREAIRFVKENNLLVEGMSDHLYLSNWSNQFAPALIEKTNIFPGSGASTVPTLASLFIGWGIPFIALLDRDNQGIRAKEKLMQELLIPENRIVQPKDSLTIEDVFAPADFQCLLGKLDPTLTINVNEKPSSAIRRQKIDKIILARTFAEVVHSKNLKLSRESEERITRLLKDLLSASEAAAAAV